MCYRRPEAVYSEYYSVNVTECRFYYMYQYGYHAVKAKRDKFYNLQDSSLNYYFKMWTISEGEY